MANTQGGNKVKCLSQEELERYARQIMLPSIGKHGQERLRSAKVCVAGIGGLGSASAHYLVAAGVGQVRIVDRDRVELSNLNRQILHWSRDLGKAKTGSAADKLSGLNPHCFVEPVTAEINEENAAAIVSDCSIIIDALDNIETRKILSKISVRTGIPFIYGGIDGFNGMASSFIPGTTPCFECLFSHIDGKKKAGGVIGAAAGIIGSIQALEAIKVILGLGASLAGKLLYFSGMDVSFREIIIERDPDCRICGRTG